VKRSRLGHWNCGVARTLDVVGDWWTLLIIRDLLFGIVRFEDLQEDLGIARNVLSQRLQQLTAEGLVDRHRYHDRPPRYEYLPTAAAFDLFYVLGEMMRWGETWRSEQGRRFISRHLTCGQDTLPGRICDHCEGPLDPFNVEFRPGPGFRYIPEHRLSLQALLGVEATDRLAEASLAGAETDSE
jgi:DNA-binding HxlR family transcriptional regulator